MKLESQHKHVMRLLAKDCDPSGWASVSETLYPSLSKGMPKELVAFEKLESGGRARLTDEGKSVLNALEWL